MCRLPHCTECQRRRLVLRLDVSKELEAIDKNRNFSFAIAATSDIGRRDPPASHYLIAGRPAISARTSSDDPVGQIPGSELSLCTRCLCGECYARYLHHRDTERTKFAQRIVHVLRITSRSRARLFQLQTLEPASRSLPCSRVTLEMIIPQRRCLPDTRPAPAVTWRSLLTPNVPMCAICHSEVNNSNPPLKAFPGSFKESFNVKFDHSQHLTGSARPRSGCAACHTRMGNRASALTIPSSLSAHNQCYTCHTPGSRSQAGRDLGSCNVCHDQKSFTRTPTNARAFRFAFSHAKHSGAQGLDCTDCHRLIAGAPQSRQVSSPAAFEHFSSTRGSSCLTCHNGRRSFGGDLAFDDCRRCNTSATFEMPQ